MEIVKVDHTASLELLLEQFKNSENLTGLIRVNAAEANLLQDAIFEVRDLYWLDTATGVQLDVIGSILNTPRSGKTDYEYRIELKGVATLTFSGTPEEVINAVKSTYGLTHLEMAFYASEPAAFYLYSEDDPGVPHSVLDRWSPAGVRGWWVEPIYHGDLAEDDILVDAAGDVIGVLFQSQAYEAITGDGDSLVWDDGVPVGLLELE